MLETPIWELSDEYYYLSMSAPRNFTTPVIIPSLPHVEDEHFNGSQYSLRDGYPTPSHATYPYPDNAGPTAYAENLTCSASGVAPFQDASPWTANPGVPYNMSDHSHAPNYFAQAHSTYAPTYEQDTTSYMPWMPTVDTFYPPPPSASDPLASFLEAQIAPPSNIARYTPLAQKESSSSTSTRSPPPILPAAPSTQGPRTNRSPTRMLHPRQHSSISPLRPMPRPSDRAPSPPAPRAPYVRASHACNGCRRRKVRCVTEADEPNRWVALDQRVCDRCRRMGLQCLWNDESKPSLLTRGNEGKNEVVSNAGGTTASSSAQFDSNLYPTPIPGAVFSSSKYNLRAQQADMDRIQSAALASFEAGRQI